MANLTAQQVTDLANNFLQINQSIEDFRFDPASQLSDGQKQDLDDLLDQISQDAQDILALSTTLVMNDVQESLAQIKTVTNQIKATYKDLTNIQKGIDVAADVVSLAAAIISKKPLDIAEATSKLVKTWET